MRNIILLATFSGALALSACNKPANEETRGGPGAGMEGATSNAAASANTADPEPLADRVPQSDASYIAAAARGDLFEIKSGQLALTRSKSPEVQALAGRLIRDHGDLSTALSTAVDQAGMTNSTPQAMDTMHNDMLADLRKASDKDFDAAFLSQQVQAHQEALRLHQAYAQGGTTAQLRDFASHAVSVISAHLDAVQKLANAGK